jgi:signal transduction histidine kinase
VSDFRRYFAEHPEFVARAVQLVRIVDVNDATLRLFGAGSKDELLVSLHKVFTPETLDVFAGELLAVAEGRTSFAAEAVLQRLDGERLDVAFTIAFPPEPASLERVLVSIMDVTARKRAEDALRTAQAELARASTLTTMGQLAASIAHELRQPLAAIAMNGSAAQRWLSRESPDLAEAREAASRIVREAHRADEVIRGLRALVGKSELRRDRLDVNDAIHEVLDLARGELRRNEVSVQADLDPTLPPALGDRVQLQQVLLNLIVNAIEAMAPVADRPRVLAIRTERTETGEVAVAIEDSGPGLDPATAARAFDPFFTTKPDGLGMGLSICRSIVEAHGGRLSLSPRMPHGTAFRFTIPTTAEATSTSSRTEVQQQARA